MSQFVVQKSVYLNASPDVVWDALTNPAKTKQYFFNCEVFSDLKPFSKITFKGRMFLFIKIEMTGEIISALPGKLLKYKLDNAKSGTTSTVTDTLIDENGTTRLNISDDVGDGPGAQDRYDRSAKGWDKVLKGLKKVIEG